MEKEMGRVCGTYGEKGQIFMVLVGTPEERRPLGRSRWKVRIMIKRILEKWDGGLGQDSFRWGEIHMAGYLEKI